MKNKLEVFLMNVLLVTCSFFIKQVVKGQNLIMPELNDITIRTFNGDTVIFAKANGIPAFIAAKKQDLPSILDYMQLTAYQFSLYNDLPLEVPKLSSGVIYYLRPKSNKAKIPYHYIRKGESLWDISQLYGIKQKKLLKKNLINSPLGVKYGQKIYLINRKDNKNNIEIDNSLSGADVIDPWLPIKQRFYKEEVQPERRLTGKAIVQNENTDLQQVQKGFHVVQKGESLFSVSLKYGVTILDLLEWNQLENETNLTEGTTLIVKNPKGILATSPQSFVMTRENTVQQASLIFNELDAQTNEIDSTIRSNIQVSPEQNNQSGLHPSLIKTLEHNVEKGEYVHKLSDKYGVMPQDIIRWNKLSGKAWLIAGQKILIKKIESKLSNPRIHNVRKGETIYQILGIYEASLKDLINWNELNDYTIYPGQDLIVSANGYMPLSNVSLSNEIKAPKDETKADAENGNQGLGNTFKEPAIESKGLYKWHTVQQGEDIYQIAARYGQTIHNLRAWNNLTYNTKVKQGQKLKVRKLKEGNLE